MLEQLLYFLSMLPSPLFGLCHAVFICFGTWIILRALKLLWDILPIV